jgi:hypothetical protein
MRTQRVSRRHLLRGAAHATIALPLLETMGGGGRARAAAGPKRFVVFFTPNGTNSPEDFMPKGAGADFTLGLESDPLLAHKKDLLALSGIDMKSAQRNADGDLHAIGMSHMLTCVRAVRADGYDQPGGGSYFVSFGGGVSIDQKIAQLLGGKTRFPSLELGVQSVLGIGAHPFSRMSYRGPSQPVPAQDDPVQVFNRLFTDLPASTPGASPTAADVAREQRRSILDFVSEDYRKLSARLGARDKEVVDTHLAAIRDIEQRLAKPLAAGCRRPEPALFMATRAGDPKQFPFLGKLQMDLMALAFACDLTRVGSLQWSWARSTVAHTWANSGASHHQLSHGGKSPQLSAVNRWYAQQVAAFVGALKAQPEGGGSVFDGTVVYWCSDVALGPSHGFANVRAFLLGTCGGHFKTGQHVSFMGESHTRLMVSLMQAMGLDAKEFGDPALPQGPLPGLT